jgi:nickel transport protein
VVVATLATPPAQAAKTVRDEHLATLSFVLPHLPE